MIIASDANKVRQIASNRASKSWWSGSTLDKTNTRLCWDVLQWCNLPTICNNLWPSVNRGNRADRRNCLDGSKTFYDQLRMANRAVRNRSHDSGNLAFIGRLTANVTLWVHFLWWLDHELQFPPLSHFQNSILNKMLFISPLNSRCTGQCLNK